MINAKRLVSLLAVGLIVTTGLIIARTLVAQDAIDRRFDQFDANKDGKLIPSEVNQEELFKQFDVNRDGEVTRAEVKRVVLRDSIRQLFTGRNGETAKNSNDSADSPVAAIEAPVRQGPQPLKPGEHGIGKLIDDLAFRDILGKEYRLSQFHQQQAIVLAMTSTSCPISKKYIPTLEKLTHESDRKITWILINPVASDKLDDMKACAERLGENVIYVHDQDAALATALTATTTTDAFVLGEGRTVLFHGAIDDQYGFGYTIDQPRHRYLADALSAIQAGKSPRVAATSAPGCALDLEPTPVTDRSITYHNRISRIINRYCAECHRDGGVAPFTLESYADVKAHAGMIEQVVTQGTMPPWFAADTSSNPESKMHTLWSNDRSLATADKEDLLTWLAGEKLEGDSVDALPKKEVTQDWLIGKPDAIFEFSQPVPIKATGTMPYQNVLVDTNLAEERWVQAIEVQPGNREVVHHVLVFALGDGDSANGTGDDAADERSGYWALYVPGNSTLVYPDGFAKRLPKGARLRFQMHYTPNGTATTDKTRIGVIYAKEPPKHEVKVVGIVNARLNIPPGEANHREEAVLQVPTDARILGYLPHMHLRGKACRYELTRKSGEKVTLLDVPRYDFNWQLMYAYHEPLDVVTGDKITFTAWYDNSSGNPANPDPTQRVRWGAQTFDEMHLGYVEYYLPNATPGEGGGIPNRTRLGNVGTGQNIEAIFKRLDRNSDGKVTIDEMPERQKERILQLDRNNDETVTLDEALQLRGN